MPRIIDYPFVEQTLAREGYRCNYPMSGSFSLTQNPIYRGWLADPDETILEHLLPSTRIVPIDQLSIRAIRAWCELLPGALWLLPMSHWSFELTFGHAEEIAALLAEIGVDAKSLQSQTTGTALEFDPSESPLAQRALSRLLQFLLASDFNLVFPGQRASCMIHHHKQLWWTAESQQIVDGLDRLASGV